MTDQRGRCKNKLDRSISTTSNYRHEAISNSSSNTHQLVKSLSASSGFSNHPLQANMNSTYASFQTNYTINSAHSSQIKLSPSQPQLQSRSNTSTRSRKSNNNNNSSFRRTSSHAKIKSQIHEILENHENHGNHETSRHNLHKKNSSSPMPRREKKEFSARHSSSINSLKIPTSTSIHSHPSHTNAKSPDINYNNKNYQSSKFSHSATPTTYTTNNTTTHHTSSSSNTAQTQHTQHSPTSNTTSNPKIFYTRKQLYEAFCGITALVLLALVCFYMITLSLYDPGRPELKHQVCESTFIGNTTNTTVKCVVHNGRA